MIPDKKSPSNKISIEYLETSHGRLLRSIDFYKALGYSSKNYRQWLKTTLIPRGTLNEDYFWDHEEHLPYAMPQMRLRYLVTTEFAKALALQVCSKEGKMVWKWIRCTEGMKTPIPLYVYNKQELETISSEIVQLVKLKFEL